LLVAGVILAAGNKVPNMDFAVLGFTVCNGDNSRQENRIIVIRRHRLRVTTLKHVLYLSGMARTGDCPGHC
jgi:hypothetical protein